MLVKVLDEFWTFEVQPLKASPFPSRFMRLKFSQYSDMFLKFKAQVTDFMLILKQSCIIYLCSCMGRAKSMVPPRWISRF